MHSKKMLNFENEKDKENYNKQSKYNNTVMDKIMENYNENLQEASDFI